MSKSVGFIFYVYEKERGMSESCKSATGPLTPAFPQRNKPIKIEHLRLVVSSATLSLDRGMFIFSLVTCMKVPVQYKYLIP